MLAGGPALATPFGTFYGPNITPDPTYGIGRWSDADFIRALREGSAGGWGPSLPRLSLSLLHLDDRRRHARSQGLYLLPAAGRPAQPRAGCLVSLLLALAADLLALAQFHPRPLCAGSRQERRSGIGAPISCGAWPIAGNAIRPGTSRAGWRTASPFPATRMAPIGLKVPNITPDKATGIGSWQHSQLVMFLESRPAAQWGCGRLGHGRGHRQRHQQDDRAGPRGRCGLSRKPAPDRQSGRQGDPGRIRLIVPHPLRY